MRQYILDLLKRLEKELPPPDRCHHGIFCMQYGSDEKGWEDKFTVVINYNGTFQQFFLDDEDLKTTPIDVVEKIVALAIKKDSNTQYGVGMGKAI